ncbi:MULTISPECIES: ABC transporter permease [unclassified Mesorhizobium]|uniref:ABC transporter permease n=1 Tax=unclassified Mesorhizobium TaxID=325217 RepID=UPI000A9BEEA7|nr:MULTISPECIES: ABC transporter permease [unclassified Mesorhizobium]MBN9254178.1 ABC transporter permease [Mesorhizobium sp.]MBN9273205.1 ABC transporter permease [Mesorhizobium sp.]
MSSIALSAGENAKTIRSARRLDRRRMLFWVVPPVAWFTVFMLIPYAMLLYTSLGRVEDMRFIPGLSLRNFIQVFTVDPYLSVIIKSARIGLMTAVLSAIVAYPLSFFLAFHVRSSRLKFLIYLLVIVPWWASYLVKAYAWKTILGSGGILNALLQKAGLTDEPVRIFLYNEFSVVVTLTYIFTPFAVLSIYAQLERIPTSLIEAARNLGAGGWMIFWRIIAPISVPGVVAGGIITFSLAFGDFVAPVLVGGPDSVMISNIVINLLGVAFDWPMAAAIGLVIITLGLLLISASGWLEEKTQIRF